MIRLLQRRLIIPRGDTGTFSVPVISSFDEGDVAIFSIINPATQKKIFDKTAELTENLLSINFNYNDTINLPIGKFLWDIKIYHNPVYEDNELVDAEEVHSYYAGFNMPECEIRQTGDRLLMDDNVSAMPLTLTQFNAIQATLNSLSNKINTITALPRLPDNDGEYVLKVEIVQGTPTYRWVSEL